VIIAALFLAALAFIMAVVSLILASKAHEAATRAEAHAADALHPRKVYRFQIPREDR